MRHWLARLRDLSPLLVGVLLVGAVFGMYVAAEGTGGPLTTLLQILAILFAAYLGSWVAVRGNREIADLQIEASQSAMHAQIKANRAAMRKQIEANRKDLADERIRSDRHHKERRYRDMLIELDRAFRTIVGLERDDTSEDAQKRRADWHAASISANQYDDDQLTEIVIAVYDAIRQPDTPSNDRLERMEKIAQLIASYATARLKKLEAISVPEVARNVFPEGFAEKLADLRIPCLITDGDAGEHTTLDGAPANEEGQADPHDSSTSA